MASRQGGRALTCCLAHEQAQAEEHSLGSTTAPYLRWRERQCLDRSALGRHAVAGVKEGKAGAGGILRDRGEGDLPLLLPLQHGGWCAKAHLCMWGDGDELPLAALAQVGNGVAVQAVLGDIGQGCCWLAGGLPHWAVAATAAASGGLLGQVELGQITPSVWVLLTRETIRSSPGRKPKQPTGADARDELGGDISGCVSLEQLSQGAQLEQSSSPPALCCQHSREPGQGMDPAGCAACARGRFLPLHKVGFPVQFTAQLHEQLQPHKEGTKKAAGNRG